MQAAGKHSLLVSHQAQHNGLFVHSTITDGRYGTTELQMKEACSAKLMKPRNSHLGLLSCCDEMGLATCFSLCEQFEADLLQLLLGNQWKSRE